MSAGLPALPNPAFVNDADGLDPNKIVADMVAAFQAASGRTLQPAQVERLLINLYAYRESLVRNAIQWAGMQNLLAFAAFPMLDYLGQLLGVTRLGSQPALTAIQFTLANPLTVSVTIPAGALVGTQDGQFQFGTSSALIIEPGQTTGVAAAACTASGEGGNGYLPGQIDVLLSPNALIASASNTTISSGGSSPETDDHLRARIQAAPNSFSVAGPGAAYRCFAMAVDPGIIDAQITSPVPGTVNVYVLTGPISQPAVPPNNAGVASASLLAAVLAALSDDKVRPLTDTVNVNAVIEIDYEIDATVTLFSDADPANTQAAVEQAAQQFAINLASRIQRDIVPEEIIAALTVPGVYRVQLATPSYQQLTPGQWANCSVVNVTIQQGAEHS
ncbi:MAG TPA: baseplate J/gp47 family protein [Candidatus Binataceae bacterium]|nr:baseplate J/gp47 family protein [Candidatus Binataceae bacterium]